MNVGFKNRDFWLLYERLYLEYGQANPVLPWLNQFSNDFEVLVETHQHVTSATELREQHLNSLVITKIESEHHDATDKYGAWYEQTFTQYKREFERLPENSIGNFEEQVLEYETTTLTFEFPLPLTYKLRLSLEIDVEHSAIPQQTLFLADGSGVTHELGFWDSAHWHPYCLRLNELELLERYWDTEPGQWQNSGQLAWALLAKFVGIDRKEDLATMAQKYDAILSDFGVESAVHFHCQENAAWVETRQGHEFICVQPPNYLDNLPEVDRKKDWFKALTYSFRKQNYADVEDYLSFPFEPWAEIFEHLN